MKKSKWFSGLHFSVVCLLVIVVLGGLVGSVGWAKTQIAAKAPEPKDIKGTITIMTPLDITIEHPFFAEAKKWFDAFKKAYPNVDIKFRITGWGPDVATQFNLAVEGGETPDVLFFSRPEIPSILPTGALENLNPYIARDMDKSDFIEWILEGATYFGKVVAMPLGTDLQSLIYRKDWFQKAGLEPPVTWDDLVDVAKALTKDTNGDGKIDIWGFGLPGASGQASYSWGQYLIASGGTLTDGKGNATYDSPAGVRALQFWMDLMHKDKAVSPADVGTNNDSLRDALIAGKLGMGVLGGAYVGALEQSAIGDKLGVVPIPRPKDGKHVSFAGGWTYIMGKQSKNKEAVWAFIKFMASTEMQIAMNKHFAGIPARKSSLKDKAFSSGLIGDQIKTTMKYGVEYPYDTLGAFWTILDTSIQEGLMQRKTATQALKDGAKEYNATVAPQFGQ